jgi:hypothetical protein
MQSKCVLRGDSAFDCDGEMTIDLVRGLILIAGIAATWIAGAASLTSLVSDLLRYDLNSVTPEFSRIRPRLINHTEG